MIERSSITEPSSEASQLQSETNLMNVAIGSSNHSSRQVSSAIKNLDSISECEVLTLSSCQLLLMLKIPSIYSEGVLKKIYQEIQQKETVFYCYYLVNQQHVVKVQCPQCHLLVTAYYCRQVLIHQSKLQCDSLSNKPIEISEIHQC